MIKETDIEIVVEKFKKTLPRFLIITLEKTLSLCFYKRKNFSGLNGCISVDLGTKEFYLLLSFFNNFLFSKKSVSVRILNGTKYMHYRLNKVTRPTGIYYRGLNKLAKHLSNSTSKGVLCSFSNEYKDITIDSILVESFRKYILSINDKINNEVWYEIRNEIFNTNFNDSSIVKFTGYITVKLDEIF
jgi:hypothetical protein